MSLTRIASIHAGKREATADGDLIVSMAFASQQPYERWWGIEVLQVDDNAVRLHRLNDGAPVLFNHDWDDLRGVHVPGSVRADADGVLRGDIRLTAATQAGRDAIGLVQSGVLTKSSVGYQIHRVIEQTTKRNGERVEREIDGATFQRLLDSCTQLRDGRAVGGDLAAFRRGLDAACGPVERADDDEPPVYLVTDWEPLENSLVTVPADNTVGVGRSAQLHTLSQPAAPAANPTEKAHTMADTNTQAAAGQGADIRAGEPPVQRLSATEAEQQRIQAIRNLCAANSIDERVAVGWVQDGTPLTKVAEDILKVMEERGRLKPTAASSLGLSSRETDRYSLFRAIRALHYGARDPKVLQEAAYEIELSRAVAQKTGRGETLNLLVPGEVLLRPLGGDVAGRAMATTPGSKGGYAVNVENMGFIDILRNRSVSMNMGARVLPGLVGNVAFTRQTGKPSVTWQTGEHTSVTAADQTLGMLSMSPKTAIAITDVSEQLLRQSSPSAEAFVMADLAKDIAIDGVDYAVINGTGGAQPLGIKNTTGVTTGQDASSATYAKILAFASTAAAANAILSNPGFVTNAAGAAVLMQKQRFSSTDTPLWDGNIMDGSLVGFRAMASEQAASGNLIFGSWGEVVIGEWGVLELATDTGGTRFNTATVGIRAMWMVDVMLRYPQAFVVSTSLSA